MNVYLIINHNQIGRHKEYKGCFYIKQILDKDNKLSIKYTEDMDEAIELQTREVANILIKFIIEYGYIGFTNILVRAKQQ